MNKTPIDWTDFTWNPVSGCRGPAGDGRHCYYCYAKRLAHGRLRHLYLANRSYFVGNESDPFAPRFWPNRLDEPAHLHTPSKIFVCSQGELFGDWVPESWQRAVYNIILANGQHTFQLLTHQPQNLVSWPAFPPNTWVGATATNAQDLLRASLYLHTIKAPVRFASIEPLLSPIDTFDLAGLDWVIVGAQTGPSPRTPNSQWVQNILDAADRLSLPVFLKRNLRWPIERQEWPRKPTTHNFFPDPLTSKRVAANVYRNAPSDRGAR
jgi:protein gp37